jgi:menaquinone-dependent protoporphyrinogen oxidase
MKTLILYGTTYGCTEKCAFKLAKYMTDDVSVLNLEDNKEIDITDYEIVIIGGSIRLGRMNRSVSNFCRKYLNVLLQKDIGLFICCMNEIEQAKEYLEAGFPRELQNRANAKGYFGGELNLEEMTPFERSLLKNVINIDESISLIKEGSIKNFARIISNST